ncbi:PAS domain-containing hybrid sensor histidine kinase/response regulator [soil metagenome]
MKPMDRSSAKGAEAKVAKGYLALVEAAADGVILMDASGQVLNFNSACEHLFGYEAKEVIGGDVNVLIPWRHRQSEDPEPDGPSREHSRNVASIGHEIFGQRKDGSTFPLEFSVGEIRDGDGDGTIFVGIVHDLSERNRANDALHDSERSLRLLVEGIVDYAIYMLDPQGHVTNWNKGAARIKQYAAEEVVGRHFGTFYLEEQRLSGEPDRNLETAKRDGSFSGEGWRLRKDGSRFWASVVIDSLRDDRGELIGYAKITRDITEQRRAAFREASVRVNTIVQTVADGVIWIDSDGLIQMFNRACENLFGHRAEEVIGQNVKMLMPEPYNSEHDRYLRNYNRSGVKKIIGIGREVMGRRKDGSTFPMELSVGEANQDGEAIFVGIIHDLTERKRTEEQLVQAQKMEIVGQLSGGIAHDFNNLLTVIVGNAELLSEQLKMRRDLRQLSDDIGRAADRGAELTQRLLAFSRQQILRPVDVDCNKLLDGVHKMLRRTVREDIEINTMFEPDLAMAVADAGQLESAVLNLAVNAKDAMPRGGRLTISTANASLDDHYQRLHPEVAPGDYVLIAVTDDGEGMPKEVIDRAFEPFFTTKDVGKGSGLGLSMVYGFVKQSSGHVSIYSEPGLGTTVRVYLPQAVSKVPRSGDPLQLEEAALPRGSETVLVVEDDPFVRSYAVMRLQSLGYSVVAAVNGANALEKLRTELKIDVLFTDIAMPGGINGWELSERAQRVRPGLPVLLTSGYALETLARHGQHKEGYMVLTKPYRKADLARRLREVIGDTTALQPTSPVNG